MKAAAIANKTTLPPEPGEPDVWVGLDVSETLASLAALDQMIEDYEGRYEMGEGENGKRVQESFFYDVKMARSSLYRSLPAKIQDIAGDESNMSAIFSWAAFRYVGVPSGSARESD